MQILHTAFRDHWAEALETGAYTWSTRGRTLAEEGFLERKRKAGTRVLNSPVRKAQFSIPLVRDEIAGTGAEYRYALVERSVAAARA